MGKVEIINNGPITVNNIQCAIFQTYNRFRLADRSLSNLLKKYIPHGKQIGFHNRADDKIYNSQIFFFRFYKKSLGLVCFYVGKGL